MRTSGSQLSLKALNEYIHREIPITRHMEFKACTISNTLVEIEAPLDPNINHRHSAFGGSLSSLGILSGWVLLLNYLQDENMNFNLVIQNSRTKYLKPALGKCTVCCELDSEKSLDIFLATLKRRGKARINLLASIYSDGIEVATHKGSYVALRVDQQ